MLITNIPVILMFIFVCLLETHQTRELQNSINVSLTNDTELMMISEELFNKSNELLSCVQINFQGDTTFNFTDNAPERLLNLSCNICLPFTIKSLIKLFDNYELNTQQPEVVTKEEEIEENEFMENLIKTDIMLRVMNFLSIKGFFENNVDVYKNILRNIWFGLYSRSKGVNGSSGFEHVFLGEWKHRKGMTGLHNWISFSLGELSNKINYLGYSCKKEFTGKAVILETFFTYIGKRKMSTMFIGTLPELEIALYTLCFFTRPNKKCKVSFKEFKFYVQTYKIQNNSAKFVAAAFPVFGKT